MGKKSREKRDRRFTSATASSGFADDLPTYLPAPIPNVQVEGTSDQVLTPEIPNTFATTTPNLIDKWFSTGIWKKVLRPILFIATFVACIQIFITDNSNSLQNFSWKALLWTSIKMFTIIVFGFIFYLFATKVSSVDDK